MTRFSQFVRCFFRLCAAFRGPVRVSHDPVLHVCHLVRVFRRLVRWSNRVPSWNFRRVRMFRSAPSMTTRVPSWSNRGTRGLRSVVSLSNQAASLSSRVKQGRFSGKLGVSAGVKTGWSARLDSRYGASLDHWSGCRWIDDHFLFPRSRRAWRRERLVGMGAGEMPAILKRLNARAGQGPVLLIDHSATSGPIIMAVVRADRAASCK
jgi:hypothetical protein